MESDARRVLATARWIVTLMYVVPLVVFPVVGRMVKVGAAVDAEGLRVLALVLGIVGLGDYAISLVLEQRFLAQARARAETKSGHNAVVTAALVVAALGASLAVYGLVLTLLGAPKWGSLFYVLCAAHGLHLMVRWPRYARAAEGAPY